MRFRPDDELLSMSVVRRGADEHASYVVTVTDGGWAKRSRVEDYRVQGRAGFGIKAMKLADARGSLVGALVVSESDEVLAIRSSGGVTRSPVAEVPVKGRDTMGVKFVDLGERDAVVAIARNAEAAAEDEVIAGAVADGDAEASDDGKDPQS
jgi:DNA gyrase subunit A